MLSTACNLWKPPSLVQERSPTGTIDFIKMDIEGSEQHIFPDASSRRVLCQITCIFMELHWGAMGPYNTWLQHRCPDGTYFKQELITREYHLLCRKHLAASQDPKSGAKRQSKAAPTGPDEHSGNAQPDANAHSSDLQAHATGQHMRSGALTGANAHSSIVQINADGQSNNVQPGANEHSSSARIGANGQRSGAQMSENEDSSVTQVGASGQEMRSDAQTGASQHSGDDQLGANGPIGTAMTGATGQGSVVEVGANGHSSVIEVGSVGHGGSGLAGAHEHSSGAEVGANGQRSSSSMLGPRQEFRPLLTPAH